MNVGKGVDKGYTLYPSCPMEVRSAFRWGILRLSPSRLIPILGILAVALFSQSLRGASQQNSDSPTALVTNVRAAQQERSDLVDVYYDLNHAEPEGTSIYLQFVIDGETLTARDVTGDVGRGITNGADRHIVWDAGTDWPDGVSTDVIADVVVGVNGGVARTGQTVSYAAGDDGDLQRGVEPPDPRFTDHGDGTVTDNLTGLMWVKAPHELDGNSANSVPSGMTWTDALTFCNDLEFAGYDDWVLPNIRELESLVDLSAYSPALPSSHPFTISQTGSKMGWGDPYWSSSSRHNDNESIGYAWSVNFIDGGLNYSFKHYDKYVWPVRSGE